MWNDIGWCAATKGVEVQNDIGWCTTTKGVEVWNDKGSVSFLFFLLYRKDRLWRSLELKNARTEAGTTTRRFLD